MQEQIEREAIAVTITATRFTAKVLVWALKTAARQIARHHREAQTPRGRQSVRKLMNHNVATNTIEIDGDRGLFDRVARKWGVDYAFHKTGKDKYLLLFKSGQADAITAAFSEYTTLVMRRAQERRPRVMDVLAKAAERTGQDRTMNMERIRVRQTVRE